MLRDPLASTAQPLSSGSPDCSSVTRLLLGPCYTDPEILDAEGTQLSGQTELLKLGSLGPRNQPALPLLGLLLGFFFFFPFALGNDHRALFPCQPLPPGLSPGTPRQTQMVSVKRLQSRKGMGGALATSRPWLTPSLTEPVGNNS